MHSEFIFNNMPADPKNTINTAIQEIFQWKQTNELSFAHLPLNTYLDTWTFCSYHSLDSDGRLLIAFAGSREGASKRNAVLLPLIRCLNLQLQQKLRKIINQRKVSYLPEHAIILQHIPELL